jgi:hypothetical protein
MALLGSRPQPRRNFLDSLRKNAENFPQGLKPDASKAVMSELKLRPPKGNDFFPRLLSPRENCFAQFGTNHGVHLPDGTMFNIEQTRK